MILKCRDRGKAATSIPSARLPSISSTSNRHKSEELREKADIHSRLELPKLSKVDTDDHTRALQTAVRTHARYSNLIIVAVSATRHL